MRVNVETEILFNDISMLSLLYRQREKQSKNNSSGATVRGGRILAGERDAFPQRSSLLTLPYPGREGNTLSALGEGRAAAGLVRLTVFW